MQYRVWDRRRRQGCRQSAGAASPRSHRTTERASRPAVKHNTVRSAAERAIWTASTPASAIAGCRSRQTNPMRGLPATAGYTQQNRSAPGSEAGNGPLLLLIARLKLRRPAGSKPDAVRQRRQGTSQTHRCEHRAPTAFSISIQVSSFESDCCQMSR